ncbi:hypothetical protein [Paraliomyxa miuraensis]|uniref:hypothetical protein n=1 Tax=Paraliomyxa miuraensis TaxID=376150 RepID=UPI002252F549|nr:hypothetical protein [Paraliomyxa miuraensis]MCX4242690.1 hypothetical protein [Paraliomyxa miuraensis]
MKTIPGLLVLSILCAPLAACDVPFGPTDIGDDDDVSEEGELEDDEDDENDENDEDDATTTTGASIEPDPGDPNVVTAFAIRHGDLPSPGGGGLDSGGDDGGSDIDPDALLVVITNGAATCEDPFAANECGTRWSVSFTLPPALQQPGSYDLWPDLNGGFSVTGEPYPEGDCSWGGGTLEGVVDILAITDEGLVRGAIHGADAFDFDANVTFDAVGCP